jgi:hypothetical protein
VLHQRPLFTILIPATRTRTCTCIWTQVWMLPTLALIRGEKVVDYVVGFDDLGGKDDFTTGEVWWLGWVTEAPDSKPGQHSTNRTARTNRTTHTATPANRRPRRPAGGRGRDQAGRGSSGARAAGGGAAAAAAAARLHPHGHLPARL